MFRAIRFLVTVAALASLALLVLAVGGRIPAGEQGSGPLAAPALNVAAALEEASTTISEQARILDWGSAPDMWRRILFEPARVALTETGRVIGVLGQVVSPSAGPPKPTPTPTP